MIQITAVKPLKRHLYAVYSGSGFLAALDSETVLSAGLKTGTTISENEWDKLVRLSNQRCAEQKALRLLEYRDHSKAELEKKLRRVTDGDAAADAAEKMERLGLVNDGEYAGRLAASLIHEKFYSRRRTVYELRNKGIDAETAQSAVDGVDSDDVEQIRELLRRRFRNLPDSLADEKTRRRAAAMLARYGYGWDDIRSALEEPETDAP